VDKLVITGLESTTLIGVRDWERRVRQTVSVDLELAIDAAEAGHRDDIAATVDYGALARRVTELVAGSSVRLVETLATAIAECILAEFPIRTVRVSVHKPRAVPNARDVAVTIERART
jgi:dihydroneopterin aldolase